MGSHSPHHIQLALAGQVFKAASIVQGPTMCQTLCGASGREKKDHEGSCLGGKFITWGGRRGKWKRNRRIHKKIYHTNVESILC